MEALASPRTLVEQAYAVILDAICDGTLPPGERLTQESVANRLNVSRQPINNALQMLKVQGFVREAGRRGLAVTPLEPKRFRAIYEFRSAVEPLAVTLATPHLSAESLARGRTLIARGRDVLKSGDGRALVQTDMDFHLLIYELSENPLIIETMRLNWQHLRRAMGEVLRHPELSARVLDEHAAILDAMASGKAVEAADRMRAHVVSAQERVAPTLAA